jgi:heterotetrameric sarcosine oxidase gamma subunit
MPKECATVVDASLYRSPFEGHALGERPALDGSVGVRIRAGLVPSAVLVSTWVSGEAALQAALSQLLGQTPPGPTGQIQATHLGLLMRTGPEEWLLIGDGTSDACAALRAAIGVDVGGVTDLSHARCRIKVQGPRCLDTLSKLFALDCRADAFPVGELRLSGHHHLPCSLHRRGETEFDLYVFTTYAHDQLGSLLDAALEYGVKLEGIR